MQRKIFSLIIVLTFVSNSNAASVYPFEKTINDLYSEVEVGEKFASLNLRCVALTELTIEALKAQKVSTLALEEARDRLEEEARRHLLSKVLLFADVKDLPFDETSKKSMKEKVSVDLQEVYDEHKSSYEVLSKRVLELSQKGLEVSASEQKKFQDDIKACADISHTGVFKKFKSTDGFIHNMLETRKDSLSKTKRDIVFREQNYPFEYTLLEIQSNKIGNVLKDTVNRCLGFYEAMVINGFKGLEEEGYSEKNKKLVSIKKLLEVTELQEAGLSLEEASFIAQRRIEESIKRFYQPYVKWQRALDVYESEGNETFSLRLVGDETNCAQLLNSFPD